MDKNITEYVDLDSMELWKKDIESINTSCLDCIAKCREIEEQLTSEWIGRVAADFFMDLDNQLKTALERHKELTNVNQFITTVSETVKNQ